ncbi:hypothetical protein NEOLI_001089 [Neolecta irregularis DAH-3]|uniref:Uncharacterized protein n=1 Tax=Neolecta irregularis (strain DAH-3) TaxID=1198029 RepID=A0A1U7LWN9_NEOID|nr:hypothetical protein NEOLI_001089 [Neolecta irregularis DAH-3]|eukprot:OLL27039.1 hypothetical protein NEOLI_001089 [Neolecta irregularis DAH-3]
MTFCYLSRLSAHLDSFYSIELVPFHRSIKVQACSTIEQLAHQIEADFDGSVCVAFLLDYEDDVILRWHETVDEVLPTRGARVKVIDLLHSTPLKRNIHISPFRPSSSPYPLTLQPALLGTPEDAFPASASNLDLICLNTLSLTSFAGFALRKNFLEELVFYLDYKSKCPNDYLFSLYLHANSPLRLPVLMSEITTVEGAFEIVERGVLKRWAVSAWEVSEEGKWFWKLKSSHSDLCASTTFGPSSSSDLTSILFTTFASNPKVDFEAREKVLGVICRKYFGDSISANGYLLKTALSLSKPERIRKQILFDLLSRHTPSVVIPFESAGVPTISEELVAFDEDYSDLEEEEPILNTDDSEGSYMKNLLQPKPLISDEASFVFQQNGLSPQTRREMRRKHGKLCKILGEPPPEDKLDVPRPQSVASFETSSSFDNIYDRVVGHSSKLKSAQKVYSLLGEHVSPSIALRQVAPKARSRVESVKQVKKLCKVFGEPPPPGHFYVFHTPPESPQTSVSEEDFGNGGKWNQRRRAEKLRNFFGTGVPAEPERVGSIW